jgi:hypothetical protein
LARVERESGAQRRRDGQNHGHRIIAFPTNLGD